MTFVTRAELSAGVMPEYFPKIFGPNENEALDVDGATKAMREMYTTADMPKVGVHDGTRA